MVGPFSYIFICFLDGVVFSFRPVRRGSWFFFIFVLLIFPLSF